MSAKETKEEMWKKMESMNKTQNFDTRKKRKQISKGNTHKKNEKKKKVE